MKTAPELQAAAKAAIRYFGDYLLLDEIARGGMGVVYHGRQISLDRDAAIKMIHSGTLASPSMVQRFRAEAQAMAQLDHPNIVPIYEVGEHEGQHYFSMKLAEGGTLLERSSEFRERSRSGNQKLATALAKVARAVHHAHQRGIIHRDLKPGNLLLDEKREPLVADFGLAKLMDSEHSITHSGCGMGTPHYMSPEQASGKTKQLTVAADIYSLGAILFELLTGRPPFEGDSRDAIIQKVIHEDAPRPRALNSAVDRDSETICLKCLEKDPKARYRTAEELAEDLESWCEDKPIQARPSTFWERLCKWVRRKPAIAALVALLFFVVLSGGGGIVWKHRETVRALHQNQELVRFLKEAANVIEPYVDVPLRRERLAAEARRLETVLRDSPELRADVRSVLAQLSVSLSDLTTAETLLREALTLRTNRHVREQVEVVSLLDSLGLVLTKQGRREEAEAVFRETLEVGERLVGLDRTELDSPRGHFAFLLRRMSKFAESESLYRKLHAAAVLRDGTNSAAAALAACRVAQLMLDQANHTAAEALLRQATQILEKDLPTDWRAYEARSLLGGALLRQREFGRAEPLLLSGYEGIKQHSDINSFQGRTRLAEALDWLVEFYSAAGQREKAASWKTERDAWHKLVSAANDTAAGKKPASLSTTLE